MEDDTAVSAGAPTMIYPDRDTLLRSQAAAIGALERERDQLRDATVTQRDEIEALAVRGVTLKQELEWVLDRIAKECQARDWCSEYDEWREEINDHLTQAKLPERMVNFQRTYRVHVVGRTEASRDFDEVINALLDALNEIPDHSDLEFIDELSVSVTPD